MAAEDPGDVRNAEYGFTPDDSGVATFDTVSLGFLESDIEMTVPREYGYLQLDQARVDLAGVCIRKELIVTLAVGEALVGNIQYAWDGDAPAAGPPVVLTIDDDMLGAKVLEITTRPPNRAKANDIREITIALAQSVGDGTWTIGQSAKQSVSNLSFKALADEDQLLATITDTYPA